MFGKLIRFADLLKILNRRKEKSDNDSTFLSFNRSSRTFYSNTISQAKYKEMQRAKPSNVESFTSVIESLCFVSCNTVKRTLVNGLGKTTRFGDKVDKLEKNVKSVE